MQSVYRSHVSLTCKIQKKKTKTKKTPAAPPMLVPLWVAPRSGSHCNYHGILRGPPPMPPPQRNVTLLRDY